MSEFTSSRKSKNMFLTSTTNQLVLGTTNTITLNSAAPSSSRIYTITDVGADASFVMSTGTQSFSGTTASTSSTTGTIVDSGGIGIAKNMWLGTSFSNTVNGLNGAVFNMPAITFTDSSTAVSGTAATDNVWSIVQPTIAATNATVTTTKASTAYIGGAPIKGTNQTFTNAYGLYIDSAATTSATVTEAASLYIANAPTVTSGTKYAMKVNTGQSLFNDSTSTTSATTGTMSISGGIGITKNMWLGTSFSSANLGTFGTVFTIPNITLTDSSTSGSSTTASNYTWSILQPTLNATNTSVTTTKATTAYIGGAPVQGTNQTFTNVYGLYIDSTSTIGSSATEAASLYIVDAPSAASSTAYALKVAAGAVSFNGAFNSAQHPYVTYSNNGVQTLTTSTSTTLTYGTGDHTSTLITNSSGTFTVTNAGLYLVYFKTTFTANTTGTREYWTDNSGLNGARHLREIQNAPSAGIASATVSGVILCAANDTIVIRAFQSSGGNLDSGSSTPSAQNRMAIITLLTS
jgi:hypothetical protein